MLFQSAGEFAWDEKTQGIILGAFFLGYVTTNVPGGRMAEKMGGKLAETRIFADHHFFAAHELQELTASATAQKLWLATTAKDYIRITTDPQKIKLKKLVVFDIEPDFNDADTLNRILQQTLANFKER